MYRSIARIKGDALRKKRYEIFNEVLGSASVRAAAAEVSAKRVTEEWLDRYIAEEVREQLRNCITSNRIDVFK